MSSIGATSPIDPPVWPSLRLVGAPAPGTAPAVGTGRREDRGVWLPLLTASAVLGVSPGHLRRECARWRDQGLARMLGRQWEIHRAAHPRLNATHAANREHDHVAPAAERAGLGMVLSAQARLAAATAAQRERAAQRAAAVLDFRAWRSTPGVRVRRDFAGYARARAERGAPTYTLSSLYTMCERCGASADLAAVQAALLDIGRGGRHEHIADDADGFSGGGAGGGASGGVSGGGAAGGLIGDDAWRLFSGLWLSPEKRAAAMCWRIVRERALEHPGDPAWSWPALRTVQAAARTRITPQAAIMARDGLDAWQKRCKAPMSQHPDAWGANERWDADHCRLDFFVRVAVARTDGSASWRAARPWITLWIDWRTRRVMGWVLSLTPNTHTVRLSLLRALAPEREARLIGSAPGFAWPASPGGPPRVAWLDNGKDFGSRAIAGTTKQQRRRMASRCARLGGAFGFNPGEAFGLLAALGIECHFAQPYNHNGKSRVEGFFAWLHQDFDRRFASYCGGRPGMRDRDTLDDAVADVMSLPTLAETEALLCDWLLRSNARAHHAMRDLADPETGRLLSPDDAYAAMLPARRALADPSALGLLREQFGPAVRVGRRGAPHTIAGQALHYGELDPRLHDYIGSDMRVRLAVDPADLSTARCYDAATMRLIGAISLNRAYGQRVSREALREGLAARREAQRAVRRTIDLAALGRDAVDAALHAQRRIDAAPGVADAAPDATSQTPLLVVRTPLDGQAALAADTDSAAGRACAQDHSPYDDDLDELIDEPDVHEPDVADDDLLECPEVIDDEAADDDEPHEPAAAPDDTDAFDVLEDLV